MPRIRKRLEQEKEEARKCTASLAGNNNFQVIVDNDQLHVDMNSTTCTCRKWDLTGIPCSHAISCATWLNVDAEQFVSPLYKKAVYLQAYEFSIAPCVGERLWPINDLPLQPPPIVLRPRRPKKNRRKDPHEDPKRPGKLTRHGLQMVCIICKRSGHNKRRCPDKDKNPAAQPQPQEYRLRGRPRKQTSNPDNGQPATTSESSRGRGRGLGRGVGTCRGSGSVIGGRGSVRGRGATRGTNRDGSSAIRSAAYWLGATGGKDAPSSSAGPHPMEANR